MRETVFREMDGGRVRFWTYYDGARVYLSPRQAEAMQRQGAHLVRV